MALGAIFAPLISPQNPYNLKSLKLENSSLPPVWVQTAEGGEGGARFLLGTDAQGRDIFSAVLYGLRLSLAVGFAGTLIAMAAGIALGLAAGYWRGWWDALIMRLADIQLSFPSILIALFLMAVWGPGVLKIIIAISVVSWVIYARTVRGVTLVEREKDYVAAIRALGGGSARIMLRHLLPNISTPVLVISAVQFASIVMLEATLSFLGLGVPITRPSRGMLIKFGYDEFFSGAWWIWLFPGLTLMILILALNWLADILREKLLPEG